MTILIKTFAAVGTVFATGALAQGASKVRGPSPFTVPIENEPAPKLIVDPPLPGPLARGAVLIPCRVENFPFLPVLGASAVNPSPRVGHLHVTGDADPQHRVFTGQAVTFTVPGPTR